MAYEIILEYTPPKTNMDTQNDGLEKVTPFTVNMAHEPSKKRQSTVAVKRSASKQTTTWMSSWKLGSMVSKWVITPIYPIYK